MRNMFKMGLKNEKGFTLIELITVIVVLGIILGIGVPRYAIMQAQAEWEADVVTLKSIAKMAEIYFAQGELPAGITKSGNYYKIEITYLHNAGLFDQNTVLNRIRSDNITYKSVRNSAKKTLADCGVHIWIYGDTGEADINDKNHNGVHDGFEIYFIGFKPPYDKDSDVNEDVDF
jgi:prepilin-type N-terminal cleavage/methylation domain-containing protein